MNVASTEQVTEWPAANIHGTVSLNPESCNLSYRIKINYNQDCKNKLV